MNFVMRGFVAGIHVFAIRRHKTRMAGTSPAMTGNQIGKTC
jgi:hypothetical protein